MRVFRCTFLLITLALSARAAALTPQQIVRQSLDNHRRDYLEAVKHYTYLERDEERDGTTKVTVSEVTVVHGLPYERAISRDGAPLSPEMEAKEQEKLQKRQNESPAEQAKRLHEREHSEDFLNEVPEAFNFKMLPDEAIDGRANYVIECTPKSGFRASNSRAAMFSRIRAKMWVDKEDLQWRKAEAHVIGTISIGWILARIGPGATMALEQKRLNSRDWLTSLIDVNGDAKVLLFKDHPVHERVTYYDFKPIPPQAVENISKLQPQK